MRFYVNCQNILFQSTFPRGERLELKHTTMIFRIFQSTFPRGERPNSQTVHKAGNTISIHVPAWGTTKDLVAWDETIKISIHVPAWGTTTGANDVDIMLDISIHVPAWGTTAKTYKFSIFIYTFLYKLVFFAI